MEKVGRYLIKEKIGQGAMAIVFKAHDPEIDRTLAIKLLQTDLCKEEEYKTRFVREAKGAGVLSHPNIVTVFDAGEHEGQPYIAMELVDGVTLSEVIKSKKQLPLKIIVEIGIQLVKALDYAHKNGVVHRDVKPANIMLMKDESTIKVADFGICRIEGGDATQKTRVGDLLGTPHYMSPEQVLGQKVDSRSDLFSAGVVLYQLLTGSLPFYADTLVSVAFKIVKAEAEPIDKLRPDLPLSLRRIIDRCLRKQPEKRFQTGEELAQALINVVREIDASGHGKKSRGLSLRLRWAIIMACLVALTMSITTVFIHDKQHHAMMRQVTGYGGSLAKFIATQTATPVLDEDWVALDVFIQYTTNKQTFGYLQVIDHNGIIRGSSIASEIGVTYKAPKGIESISQDLNLTVQRQRLTDGRFVLDFSTPIQFQNQNIGIVHLGIFEKPLTEVSNLTLMLLGILIIVTMLAVAMGSYLLVSRVSLPLRVLRNSLKELTKGHYDYRIAEGRNDEFGEVYKVFDATAAALQERHESPPAKYY